MKSLFSLLFGVLLLVGSAVLAHAQVQMPAHSDAEELRSSPVPARNYSDLVREVFAPITDQLNLTKEQEFQIIAIITGTETKTEPLVQELDELDERLSQATLIDSPDDATINRLSGQEALLLTQMISMKAKAKVAIYQVLTPVQRAQVSHQFRDKSQVDSRLGSIAIY